MQGIQKDLEIGRCRQLIVHRRMEPCYILQPSIPMVNLVPSPGAFRGMPYSYIAVTTTILNFIHIIYVVGHCYRLFLKAYRKLQFPPKEIQETDQLTSSNRSESHRAGLTPGPSVPDQLGLSIPASDMSLLDASSDRHSRSQGSESGYQTASQHDSPFNPYNISAPYSAENPGLQQDQTQSQYYSGSVQYSGQYIPSAGSLLSTDQISSYGPGDMTYQHQSQGTPHGQRTSYHVSPSE